jgi:hypothetical protein
LQHSRSELVWLGVTARPSAHWIARQLTEACGWQQTPGYIVRDRDCVYGDVVTQRLRAMGSERLIGSIRQDCLDHVVVFSEGHLRHLLNSYQKYYNEARTHLITAQGRADPSCRPGCRSAMPVLGGLLVRILCDCFKSRQQLEVEIMVLRHQLNVLLHRAPRRLHLRWADRALFIWL